MKAYRIDAVTLAEARAFVGRHHRHNPAPQGHKFSLGLVGADGARRGVAVVGRPVARLLDDGRTLEVVRLCTDGAANACSTLLAAAWRASRELGFHRLVTYTQDAETGASLRAAGWRKVAELRPRAGWASAGRDRRDRHPVRVRRVRWEVTSAAWDAGQFRNAAGSECDETSARCETCTTPLRTSATGRPARYCSPACRQLAYRIRRASAERKAA